MIREDKKFRSESPWARRATSGGVLSKLPALSVDGDIVLAPFLFRTSIYCEVEPH